jgi:hypothetical protein
LDIRYFVVAVKKPTTLLALRRLKGKAGPTLAALHAIVDDLNQRIEWLSRECPTDWTGPKEEIEDSICQLKDKWKSVWGIMGEEEYGIGGA